MISAETNSPQPVNTGEMIVIDNAADEVTCDGGGGTLGHPKVFYSLDGQGSVKCRYCGRVFVKESAQGQ